MPPPPAVYMFWRVASDRALRKSMGGVPFSKCLLGFAAILILNTVRFGDLRSYGLCAALCTAGVLMVYLRVVITREGIRFLLQTVRLGALAHAAIALAQALVFDTAGGYRANALYYNPNYYAMMCGFMLLCALYLLMRQTRLRPLSAAAAAAAVLGLALSNSRSGMVSAVLGALCLVLWMRRVKKGTLAAVGLLAVAGLAAFSLIMRTDDFAGSLGMRTDIWAAAVDGILARPILGHGAWAFARLTQGLPLMGELHAHNLVLEILLSVGFVGTLFIVPYLLGNLRAMARAWRKGAGNRMVPLAATVFLMVMVHGLFDVTVFGPQNAVFVLLVLAAGAKGEDMDVAPPRAGQVSAD